MEQLHKAYELLGLSPNASREDVEKRYGILLRQSKAQQQRKDTAADGSETIDFTEITRAYRYIADYETQGAVEEITRQQYAKFGKFAGRAQKIDHFFSYYKWHVLGVIALIGIIIYGIISFMDHQEEQRRLAALPPIDLKGTFIGEFYHLDVYQEETDPLEAAVLTQFSDWQRVEFDMLSFLFNGGNQVDTAMLQKATIAIATDQPDVYFLDAETYPWLSLSGVLLDLESQTEGPWKDLLPDGAAAYSVTNDDQTPRVYGIDVTNSPLVKELPLAYKKVIIGIRKNTERPEKAMAFIEKYLQAMPK